MTPPDAAKTCLVLLGMGGPDCLEDIKRYLYNIFSDRALIRLPGGFIFQKLLALIISRARFRKVKGHYQLIGGRSPLLKWTRAQAEQIQNILSEEIPGLKVFIGMRYFPPTINGAIEHAYGEGFRKFVFLPLYPQYSVATTGSTLDVVDKVLRQFSGTHSTVIKDFHDHCGYVSLLSDYIDRNISENEYLLFSAHSLPQRFVDEGDPYVDQVKETARLAAGEREYLVSFQSRTGPVKWVGPDTVESVTQLLNETSGGIFVVPISFICDHIETLYEIDIELPELAGDKGHSRIKRMPMFNDDPRFASVLASIVRTGLESYVRN